MKKTFTKRVLSIVLAMLMVITALPFTALTASAAATNIAPQATKTDYIPGTSTKTYDGNFSNGTNISDGRYGYDNNNPNSISGGLNNTNSWNYNFGKSGSSYDNAYVNYTWSEGKSISEVKVYFWVDSSATKMPNSFKIRYSNDGSNYEELTFSNHSSSSNSNCGIGNYKTLSEKNTLPNTGDSLTVVCSTFDLSSITSPIKYLQLVSTRQGTNCVGLSEIEIFGETYVAPPVDPAQQAKVLKDAMTDFENKVKTNSMCKNLDTAYTAYVNAQKAYDTFVYGGVELDLNPYITALNSAVNNLSVISFPKANAKAYYGSSEATNGYSNVIYSSQNLVSGTDSNKINNWASYVKLLSNSEYVLLYDGQADVAFPIQLRWQGAGTWNYLYYAYPANNANTSVHDNFELKQAWTGKQDTWSNVENNWMMSNRDLTFNFKATTNYENMIEKNGSNYYGFSNKVYYKGTGDTTNYYQTFNENSIMFRVAAYSGNDNGSGGSYHKIDAKLIYVPGKVYIINYKPLREKIYSAKSSTVFTNVSNYSEGGALSFINAYEFALKVDPTAFSGTTSVAVQDIAGRIKTAINGMNNASTATSNSSDYASLRSAMNQTVRTTFNGGVNDEGYTETSWNNFVTAYNNAKNIMAAVNTYGYNNASTAVTRATELTAAYNALTKCNHETFRFEGGVPATCTENGQTGIKFCAVCGERLAESETILATGHSWGAPTHMSSSTKHYRKCANCGKFDSEFGLAQDHSFKEIVTDPTCTEQGYTTYTCECSYSYKGNFKYSTGHSYTGTINGNKVLYICQNDNSHTYEVEIQNYNTAVTNANNAIANSKIYTDSSITALQTALNDNKFDINFVETQDTIDAKTSAIQSATESLVVKSFTVNVVYFDAEGNKIPNEEQQTVKYGNDITLTVPEKYSVIKWVRNIVVDGEAKDLKVAETSQSITVTVTADVTYNVTVNDLTTGSDAQNTVPVKLTNRIGKLVDAVYIPSGEYDVEVSGNTLYIGTDYKLVAPSIVFYSFGEFRINGKKVEDGEFTFDKETVISTVYNPTTSIIEINCDETCTSNVSTAYWDQKVVVTAVNGNANTKWIVNDKVVAYGPTYTFRASTNVEITCVNETEATPTATVLNLGYGSIREKTISAVCSYYLPDGYKFKEAGVLLKTSAVNGNEAVSNTANYNLVSGNAKKFVASNFVADTNQYVINVSSSKSYDSLFVGAVAYVTVTDMDGNNEQTFYSSLVTSEYTK